MSIADREPITPVARIVDALLDPALTTVGGLVSALDIELAAVGEGSLGRLSLHALGPTVTSVSVEYLFDIHHERPVATVEDLRARKLHEWTVTFARWSPEIDAALYRRFGASRELPTCRVYGLWVLVGNAAGGCTLSRFAKLPDWAVPAPDAALRERVLVALAAAIAAAPHRDAVVQTASLVPKGCGLVCNVNGTKLEVELVPAMSAAELVRVFGWRDAVGDTAAVHRDVWHIRVITGPGTVTNFPTIGRWGVIASLEGPPTGEYWAGRPIGYGGTRMFAPADRVRSFSIG